MNAIPAADPIPIPAPIELFKILHNLTLALHFIAVQVMLGGLYVGTYLGLVGWLNKGKADKSLQKEASKYIVSRLPVVMTYVINFGVPPLLFAQVLYGRLIYTSSVLIGVYWISVIILLIGCYWHIYKYSFNLNEDKYLWWKGLVALILAVAIAKIYSTNMTLMLRPEVWNEMYSKSATGIHLPPPDPTLMPRWLFMLFGGLVSGGLWFIWLGGNKNVSAELGRYLSRLGGRLATVGVLIQVPIGIWAVKAQPEAVFNGLSSNILYKSAGLLWILAMIGIFIYSVWNGFRKSEAPPARYIGAGLILVAMLGAVLCRDGIRDLTLAQKGYFVAQRVVYTNWLVVGIFLITFVLGLVGVGWLISVMMRAKSTPETAPSKGN